MRPHGRLRLLTTPAEWDLVEAAETKRLAALSLPARDAQVGVVAEDEHALWVRDGVQWPDGTYGTYIRIIQKPFERPGVVAIVVREGKLLLIAHFRHATGAVHYEFVRGHAKAADDSPLATGSREVFEEIGVEPINARLLGYGYPDSGLLASRIAVTIVELSPAARTRQESQGAPAHPASDPESQIIEGELFVSVEELRALVRAGKIEDNFTLAAFTLYCCAQDG